MFFPLSTEKINFRQRIILLVLGIVVLMIIPQIKQLSIHENELETPVAQKSDTKQEHPAATTENNIQAQPKIQQSTAQTKESSSLPQSESKISRAISNMISNIASSTIEEQLRKHGIIDKIDQYIYDNQHISTYTTAQGTGTPILCGQTARIKLLGYTEKPLVFFDNEAQEMRIKVGDMQMSRGIDLGIIGMQKGEKRTIAIPASLGLRTNYLQKFGLNPKADISYDIHMLDYEEEELHPYVKDMMIFDEKSSVGRAAMCGDEIVFHMTIKNMHGKIIHQTSTPVVSKIGSRNMPIGIDLAAIGMNMGSKRAAIMNSKLLTQPNRHAYHITSNLLPKNEYVIVSMEAEEVRLHDTAEHKHQKPKTINSQLVFVPGATMPPK